MNYDPKLCENCPWPLDCCTEDGTPKPDPLAVDCPRAQAVWDRRLGDGRLAVMTGTSLPTEELEDEVLV